MGNIGTGILELLFESTGSIPYTLYHLLFDIYKYADIPQKKFIAKLVKKEKIDIWIKNDVGITNGT